MIELISGKVACFLCSDENDKESYELYKYAVYIVLSALWHIVTIIILGVCFGLVLESILFYLSFIAIRKFAGGYHAKRPLGCYAFSVATIVLSLASLNILLIYDNLIINIVLLMFQLLCLGVIFVLAPLDTENNPLGDKEKHLYKKISIVNSSVVFLLGLLFLFLSYRGIYLALFFGTFVSTLVLVMRKIQILFQKD